MTTAEKPTATKLSFEEWIQEGQELETLREEFSEETLQRATLNRFVSKLQKKWFGTTLVFRLVTFETFTDKADIKRLKVTAHVMKQTEDGYIPYQHPLEPTSFWVVEAVIQESRFTERLNPGTLFTAVYKPAYDERHLEELITIDLNTYKEVQVSFSELLHSVGGPELAAAAEQHFGTDAEKIIAERFLLASDETAAELRKKQEEQARLLQQLNEQEKNYLERYEKLSVQARKWVETLTRARELMQLDSDRRFSPEDEAPVHPWDEADRVKMLQSLFYHNSDDDLIYEDYIIETFLKGLQSNSLVILTGPSGTGKSSIVNAFSQAIKGAKARTIPVQSSWSDTQDLLGYFNPLEKRFVASPFLEALADAKDDPDHLYLICLDEMNLAHVEYYFSEFLSAREQKEPTIRLYSKRYYQDAVRLMESDEAATETEKWINAAELIARYPYEFRIPENVRFIGTLNMDHTVKPLSPKVIDRSLVIELAHSERAKEIEAELKETVHTGKMEVTLEQFSDLLQSYDEVEATARGIIEYSEELDLIPNVRMNSRGLKQIIRYLSLSNTVRNKDIDQLIYTKLLPRISFSRKDEEEYKAVQDFRDKIAGYPLSSRKLQKMLNGTRTIHFW